MMVECLQGRVQCSHAIINSFVGTSAGTLPLLLSFPFSSLNSNFTNKSISQALILLTTFPLDGGVGSDDNA